jgi:hypothetical protein
MKKLLLVVLVASCADDGSVNLSADETKLVGCWSGFSGDEHVEYRFHDDHSVVLTNLEREASYPGQFALQGAALTLDFGEEPPTYQVTITPTTLTFVDVGFEYTRCK